MIFYRFTLPLFSVLYPIGFLMTAGLFAPQPLEAVSAAEGFHASARSAAENSSRVDNELLKLIEEGYRILDVVDHEFPGNSSTSPRLTWGTISYVLVAESKGERNLDDSNDLSDDLAVAYRIVEITIEYVVDRGYRISQVESLKIP